MIEIGKVIIATFKTDLSDQNIISPLDNAIDLALMGVISKKDSHWFWCYELEADITIPSEYIFMMHYIGDINKPLQNKMASYIRKRQLGDGGWPLYQTAASR